MTFPQRRGSIGKIKPLFTRARPPASPRLTPVSPLDAPLSHPSPSAAGALARRPGRSPAVRHPLRAPGRRRRPVALHRTHDETPQTARDTAQPPAHAAGVAGGGLRAEIDV